MIRSKKEYDLTKYYVELFKKSCEEKIGEDAIKTCLLQAEELEKELKEWEENGKQSVKKS